MISLFRTNQIIANVLLLFYAFLIRFPFFINRPSFSEELKGGIGWEYLSGFSWTNQGLTSALLAVLLIVLQGFLINIIEFKFKLTDELNLLPGMCYVLLACAIPQSFYLSPLLIAITFYLLALYEIFICYKKYLPATHIFNIGFWLSMAFLFYQSFWLFFFFAILSLSVVRNFKFKELMMLLSGFIVPIFISGVLYFLNDKYSDFYQLQFVNFISWKGWNLSYSVSNWFPLILFGIFLLLSIVGNASFHLKKGIQAKKSIDILFWSMLFALLSFLIQPDAGIIHLLILTPCLAYVFAFFLLRWEKPQAEAFHFLLLALTIFWQLNPWGW